MISHKRSRIALIAVPLLLIALVALSARILTTQGSPAVATVNGERITRNELEDRYTLLQAIQPEYFGLELSGKDHDEVERAILDVMIDERLVEQESARLGLEIDEQLVADMIELQITAMSEESPLDSRAVSAMLTGDSNTALVRARLINHLLANSLVDESALTEQEIRSHYERNRIDGQNGTGLFAGSYGEERGRAVSSLLEVRRDQAAQRFLSKLRMQADISY
jgi:parvulin-like peptidyl-prolyl isomerase